MYEELKEMAKENIYTRHALLSWERGDLTLVEALIICIKQLIDAVGKTEPPPDTKEEKEVLGGLLLVVIAAARTKAFAGLDYAGSGEHQDYPPGVIEIGVAKDAINMIVVDVMKFVEANL